MSEPVAAEMLKVLVGAVGVQRVRAQLDALESARPVVSLDEVLDRSRSGLAETTITTWRTYERRFKAAVGDRSLLDLSAADLQDIVDDEAAAHGVRSAQQLRCVANRAFARLITMDLRRDNPCQLLHVAEVADRPRRALTSRELDDLFAVAESTGNDPDLDVAILAFLRETACRRNAVCALNLHDLDPAGAATLHEKNQKIHVVPVSAALVAHIVALAAARPGAGDQRERGGAAFRYRNGDPLTRRRFNTLFERVQTTHEWAARIGVSAHWIRHTTITEYERAGGSRVAAAIAGHGPRRITDRYTTPTFDELAAVHRRLFTAAPNTEQSRQENVS